jgi:hypothetical protein
MAETTGDELTEERLAEIKEQCERDEAMKSQDAFESWLLSKTSDEIEQINAVITND